jgi:hypothetical protein
MTRVAVRSFAFALSLLVAPLLAVAPVALADNDLPGTAPVARPPGGDVPFRPAPAGLKPVNQLPEIESGALGIPEHPAPGTDAVFFDAAFARLVGQVIAEMRAAIAACNPTAYFQAQLKLDFGKSVMNGVVQGNTPGMPTDDVTRARARNDMMVMQRLQDSDAFPRYIENCPPAPPQTFLQPGETLPTMESGQLGLPENPIGGGAGAPVFDAAFAKALSDTLDAMRRAIDTCDAEAYNAAARRILPLWQGRANGTAMGQPTIERAKAKADVDTVRRYLDANWPKYPRPCTKKVGMIDRPGTGGTRVGLGVFATGGAMVAMAGTGTGAVTGVDSFFGPGAFLIDNRPGGANQAVGQAGVRVRASGSLTGGDRQTGELAEACVVACSVGTDLRLFFETGVATSFGAQSYSQGFAGVNGVPQGFGKQGVTENFQVPLLIGVSLGLGGGARFDVYGGITFDSWTHTLSGGEAGFANGFNASQSRMTVDPTLGMGFSYDIGSTVGVRGLTVGVNVEVLFRPGSVLTAQSPNFNSQVYYGTVESRANVQGTARVGLQF